MMEGDMEPMVDPFELRDRAPVIGIARTSAKAGGSATIELDLGGFESPARFTKGERFRLFFRATWRRLRGWIS
jgi:hypothetical protein